MRTTQPAQSSPSGPHSGPRVVLGMPAYRRPDTLARTLESLLSQTYQDFAIVIVEDGGAAETDAIAAAYAGGPVRIHYEANERRLGMVGNWHKVFARARALYPRSEYFAWVSDHDLWHARWLAEMVAALDVHPHVVLAYPGNLRMSPDDTRTTVKSFSTLGVTSRTVRLWRSARYMLSGDAIYGLMRADTLERAGVFRHVVTPDRQALLALSLYGEMKQVAEVLWYREQLRSFELRRQRDVFFPDGAPWYVYAPSHLQHCAVLLWDFVVKGRGRPVFGRLAGVWYATVQIVASSLRNVLASKAGWRVRLRTLVGVLHRPAPSSRGALEGGASRRADS